MMKTVLLIDYNPQSISRIRTLMTDCGFRVILATDGQAGVDEFRRSLPDLTLIQDLLPKMHGFDACRAIKTSDEGRKRPVVMLARKGCRAARVESECDAHLDKPFKDEALAKLVRGLMPEAAPAPEPQSPVKMRAPRILVDFTESDVDERLDEVMASLAV